MARLNKKDSIGKVNFTVQRGTRLERGQQVLLYDRLVEINNNQEQKLPLLKDDLELYVDLVIYAEVEGLETVDGTPVDLPGYYAEDRLHLAACHLFLQVEPDITDTIGGAIQEVNRPLAPREILPEEELTAEEKGDPDFLNAAWPIKPT